MTLVETLTRVLSAVGAPVILGYFAVAWLRRRHNRAADRQLEIEANVAEATAPLTITSRSVVSFEAQIAAVSDSCTKALAIRDQTIAHIDARLEKERQLGLEKDKRIKCLEDQVTSLEDELRAVHADLSRVTDQLDQLAARLAQTREPGK